MIFALELTMSAVGGLRAMMPATTPVALAST
jgi:hypothetical protein